MPPKPGSSGSPPPGSPPPGSPPPPPPPTDLTVQARVNAVSKGPAATELVERCLKWIALKTGLIPRDVQTIGQVFTRASSVYDGILKLIEGIEKSSDVDLDWVPFDTYTTAIPQLERFLFEFSQGYTSDKYRGAHPPSDSTANGVLYVQTWKADREFITKTYENLKHDDLKKVSDDLSKSLIAGFTEYRKTDDLAMLNALITIFYVSKKSSLPPRGIHQKMSNILYPWEYFW